jgi:hypothetical protein
MRNIYYVGYITGGEEKQLPFLNLNNNILTYIPVELNQIRISYHEMMLKFPKNENEEWEEFVSVHIDLYDS